MDVCRTLLAEIDVEMRQTAEWTGRARLSEPVRAAMRRVHREAVVPAGESAFAYCNSPLPIGHGQTISQPYIVAIMTELLDLEPDAVVLEIGTGSGYQAAVLAQLVRQVYSIEVIADLAEHARQALAREGCTNVAVRVGDGALGWPEHAPFDAIIVTAAARAIPPALVAQLKPGGRMIIPVGATAFSQRLLLLTKDQAGQISTRDVLPVAFVPLTGAGQSGAPAQRSAS